MEGLDAAMKTIADAPPKIFKNIKRLFQISAFEIQSEIIDNATNKLHRRTGNLANSIHVIVVGDQLSELNLYAYSNVIYARTHEGHDDGSSYVIRAKNAYKNVPGGPYLNIPLPPNKTPAGVMRHTASQVFAKGGHIVKSKSGKWIVLGRTHNGFAPMFVLKKEVTIPPRLGMKQAISDELPRLESRIIDWGFKTGLNIEVKH